MNNCLKLMTIATSGFFLCGAAIAATEVVPREKGAVDKQLRMMLKDSLKRFKSGIGRIAYEGQSNEKLTCQLNFYFNKATAFATFNIASAGFYNEFYIDHPNRSFRNVLFQTIDRNGDTTELKIVNRNNSFSILTQPNTLILNIKTNRNKQVSCRVEQAKAQFYEGETE